MDFQLIERIEWILNIWIVRLPFNREQYFEGRVACASRAFRVVHRKNLATNSKKELSKWQLADLFVIKTTRRTTPARITRINFHFTCRWVFAAEWPSMGNPRGANYLTICCRLYGRSRKSIHVRVRRITGNATYHPLKVRI